MADISRPDVPFPRTTRIASAGRIPNWPGKRLRKLWAFCAVIFFFGLAPPCRALDPQKFINQFTHVSWTAREGLTGPVRAIAQTRDGYLWLGTEAGLYRFDGLHLVVWESSRGEPLPAWSVLSLCVGRDGGLWIGFSTGAISRLSNGQLKNFLPAPGSPRGKILSMAEDADGAIWAAGQYAFGKIEHEKWHRVGAGEGYLAPAAQRVMVDHKGNVWVATDGYDFALIHDAVRRNTVLTLHKGANRFTPTGVPLGFVPALEEAPDGSVWIADYSGVAFIRIDGGTGRIHSIQRGLRGPFRMLFDLDGSLWLAVYRHGVCRFSDFRHAEMPPVDWFGRAEGFSGDWGFSDFEDREGNIWFGTERGLERFSESKITPFFAPQDQTSSEELGLMTDGNGALWMFDYGDEGLYCYSGAQFISLKLPRNVPVARSILSLYAEENGTVWLGGEFGLARLVGGRFSFLPVAENLRGGPVEAIGKGADGSLWISFWGADSVERPMRLKGGIWTDFRKSVDLPKYRCRLLRGDSAGRMWLGYEDGEVAVHENACFHVYSSKDGLTGGRINGIFEDSKRHIWIASDGGLSLFENRHFITLTAKKGLPGHSVAGVLEDGDGALWLAGSMGILRVDSRELDKALQSPSYRMEGIFLDAGDGFRAIPRQVEPYPGVARTPDGRLWFATTNGLATIEPRRMPHNPVPPPVTIEEIRADNRNVSTMSGATLPPNTKDLQFDYTALSLAAPQRILFRYKLEGFDPAWRGPVSTREATYTNLPPRDYRFRVIACNNDGVWNNEGAVFQFSIAPAFYQTNWFLLLCVLGVVALGWSASQWRVRQMQARVHLQLEERLSERTRIARDLHDTLLQSFQGLILSFQRARNLLPKRPAEAVEVLDNALDRSERALIEGRNAIHDIRSATLAGNDLAKELSALGQELASVGGYAGSPTFHVVVGGTPKGLDPSVSDEIYRIVREAIRNAYAHARARRIEAEIGYDEKLLRVRIRDDGVGMDGELLAETGRVSHWGLPGMRERANRIGGQLDVWSELGAGTEIELRYPTRLLTAANLTTL
jgi:signal transduction histidine kinase/ligand-binding sensor domain-containing protein